MSTRTCPLPSKLVPEMPADVDELVATMTRREPQERPADADEALALLRNVVDELTDSELSVRRGGGTGSIRTPGGHDGQRPGRTLRHR